MVGMLDEHGRENIVTIDHPEPIPTTDRRLGVQDEIDAAALVS